MVIAFTILAVVAATAVFGFLYATHPANGKVLAVKAEIARFEQSLLDDEKAVIAAIDSGYSSFVARIKSIL